MHLVAEAAGLVKTYGSLRAVDGIDFQVAERECFGFLGPNGAGKTSTMRMLFGRIQRTGGELRVFGFDPRADARSVRSRLGVVPQGDNLDQELQVLENLLIHGGYFGLSGAALRTRCQELLEFMQLETRQTAWVQDLSGGMRRRLMIARALVNEPDLLILDEPTTGLDPQARLLVWSRLAHLKERGVTVIVTTHYMEEASRLCDRLVIMDQGRIVEGGPPGELIRKHAGVEVLEVRWPLERTVPDLAGRAGILRVDRVGDRLLVFSADPAAAVAKLDLGVNPADWLVRPASLEDVFLHLTGRDLQEDLGEGGR